MVNTEHEVFSEPHALAIPCEIRYRAQADTSLPGRVGDGGGAVSFEGGTTTESWVPPCDAQRGVVDAIRLETEFTGTGPDQWR